MSAEREILESQRLRAFLEQVDGPAWDNVDAGVSGETDTISRGPAVLLTPERRGHCVHGSKP